MDRRILNRPITYSIEQINNVEVPFSIVDSTIGVISVTRELDFETQNAFCFNVTAKDVGLPISNQSASTTVVVYVLDSNDNYPRFLNSHYAVLLEGNYFPPGSVVLVLLAFDADTGVNGEIMYSIISGDPIGKFTIDPTSGVITTTRPLFENENIFLSVLASDRGLPPLSSSVEVNITIILVNNPPVFFPASYSANISVHTPIGTTVLRVNATDRDVNDIIIYSLIAPIPNIFSVDSLSGNITKINDFGSSQKFEFQVLARDNGHPVLSSIANVTIFVIDKGGKKLVLVLVT